jgi:hypothetical protein
MGHPVDLILVADYSRAKAIINQVLAQRKNAFSFKDQ